jgi:signal transduction histidine kinase
MTIHRRGVRVPATGPPAESSITGASGRLVWSAGLPVAAASLRCRRTREVLRNAAFPGRPCTRALTAGRTGGTVTAVVDGNAGGSDAERPAERCRTGHLDPGTPADRVVGADGSVTASSSPGQGARPVVTVPLNHSAARAGGAS